MVELVIIVFVILVLSLLPAPKRRVKGKRRVSGKPRHRSSRPHDIMPMFNSMKRKKQKQDRYFRKFGSF